MALTLNLSPTNISYSVLSRNRLPSHQADQFSELVCINFVKLMQFGLVSLGFCWSGFWVFVLLGFVLGFFFGFSLFSFMFWIVYLFSFASRWEGWLGGVDIRKGKLQTVVFSNRSWPISLETKQNGSGSDSGYQAEELFSTIFNSKWTDFVSWNWESQVKSPLNNFLLFGHAPSLHSLWGQSVCLEGENPSKLFLTRVY